MVGRVGGYDMSRKHRTHRIPESVLLALLISSCGHKLFGSTGVAKPGLSPVQSTQRVEKHIYKQTPQGELAIHVHFPKDCTANDKRPAIVFFFGGAWHTGTVKQFVPQAEYLAGRGMVTARADYRVSSRHGTTPDKCVEDGKSAVRWLRANAVKLGIDPNRIAASGQSAGGHIAACTYTTKGLEAEREDLSVSSKPNLLVLFSAKLDCSRMAESLGPKEMAFKISPNHNLTKDVPPAIVFYGTKEWLVADGVDFIEKSKKLGNIAELYTAEGQPHGFSNRSPWLERTIHLMDRFLARYGYTQGEPTIRLPEGKVEMKKMSPISLNAYLKDRWGFTPLHRAARYGDTESVELLIANGADVNAKDKWGYTPLLRAIWSQDKDMMKLLIAKGADVNYTPKDDSPPLHYAVSIEDKDMVELLVDNGAKFDVKDQKIGCTAFRYAASRGNRELVEFFVAKGADVSSFHIAACVGDLTRVKSFVEHGTDVNTKDELNWTPLYWAASTGQTEIAKFLLTKGANVNAETNNNQTPLHQAAKAGELKLIELLISKGGDVNTKDNHGRTPMSLAKDRGYKEIVELLRKHGVKE